MSDTTATVLIFLLGVIAMCGCIFACVLIGRHYAHKCAERAAYCAEAAERVEFLRDVIRREHGTPTDVLPRLSSPHETEIDSPLRTRGQRSRAEGRHARPDGHG
jgi:hypothetical protein